MSKGYNKQIMSLRCRWYLRSGASRLRYSPILGVKIKVTFPYSESSTC